MEPAFFALTLALALAAMAGLWLLSLALGNASIVDVWWGPGFGVLAAFSLWLAGGPTGTRGLLVVLHGLAEAAFGTYEIDCFVTSEVLVTLRTQSPSPILVGLLPQSATTVIGQCPKERPFGRITEPAVLKDSGGGHTPKCRARWGLGRKLHEPHDVI